MMMTHQHTEPTLTEALAAIGISHRPSKMVGRRDLFAADGEFVGTFEAHEAWAALPSLKARHRLEHEDPYGYERNRRF